MTKISKRHIKAWERFNSYLRAFALESEGTSDAMAILYEDAFTTREVSDFMMLADGTLLWIEEGKQEKEQMLDEDDAREWLSFWRKNLRRAKRYWSMDAVELDRLQDGEVEDINEEDR